MIDKRILKFLKDQHLASISVIKQDLTSHSFNAFYTFDEISMSLIIASDMNTEHIKAVQSNNKISGTISINTLLVAKIEGVQFYGTMDIADKVCSNIYFKRFFYAKAMKPVLWQVRLKMIKYTNNSLGFGKKITWQSDELENF